MKLKVPARRSYLQRSIADGYVQYTEWGSQRSRAWPRVDLDPQQPVDSSGREWLITLQVPDGMVKTFGESLRAILRTREGAERMQQALQVAARRWLETNQDTNVRQDRRQGRYR